MEPMGVAVQQPRRHITSGGDHVTSGSGEAARKRRTSTREKIARMVAEGASNYPSYLKLIYTGDSEEPSSSEDELAAADRRTTRAGRDAPPGGGGGRSRGRGDAESAADNGRTEWNAEEARRQMTATESRSSTDAGVNCVHCHHRDGESSSPMCTRWLKKSVACLIIYNLKKLEPIFIIFGTHCIV